MKINYRATSVLSRTSAEVSTYDISRPATPAIQLHNPSDWAQILREQSKVGIWAKFLAPNVEVGGGRWRQAIRNWHSTHATRGKRRRFAPPFPPCCIRRRIVTFCESGRSGPAGHFVSQACLGRLSHRKCPAASAAGPGVDSDAEVVSHPQPFLSQDSRFMNVDTWRAAAML